MFFLISLLYSSTATHSAAGLSGIEATTQNGTTYTADNSGAIWITRDGTTLSKPLITLPIDASAGRGFLATALDPRLPDSPWLYVYYTLSGPVAANRLSRLSTSLDVIPPGGEVVLATLDFPEGNSSLGKTAITFGADGKLSLLTGFSHEVWNVDLDPVAPQILRPPSSVSSVVGTPARFDIATTGTPPLSYQWYRDGVAIPSETSSFFEIPSTTLTDDQALFSCRVSSPYGTILSSTGRLTVQPPVNQRPTPVILAPTAGATYIAGQVISLAGLAQDAEDNQIPPAQITWKITAHEGDVTYPVLTLSAADAAQEFTISTSAHTTTHSWYRITLTAADSEGAEGSVFTDIFPILGEFSVTTEPLGIPITVDGTYVTGPYTVSKVVGAESQISVPSSKKLESALYGFAGWSDDGTETHSITVESTPINYLASFTEIHVVIVTNTPPEGGIIPTNSAPADFLMAWDIPDPTSLAGLKISMESTQKGVLALNGHEVLRNKIPADPRITNAFNFPVITNPLNGRVEIFVPKMLLLVGENRLTASLREYSITNAPPPSSIQIRELPSTASVPTNPVVSNVKLYWQTADPDSLFGVLVEVPVDNPTSLQINSVEALRYLDGVTTSERPNTLVSFQTNAATGRLQAIIPASYLQKGSNYASLSYLDLSGGNTNWSYDFSMTRLTVAPPEPQVTLVQPLSGTSFTNVVSIELRANLNDTAAAMAPLVEFFADGEKLGETSAPPYRWIWRNPPPGDHFLLAVASNDSGDVLESETSIVSLVIEQGFASLISSGETWKYWDRGSSPGSDWQTLDFNDSTWLTGPSKLGFGGRGQATTLNPGTESAPTISAYFRKTFVIPDPSSFSYLKVRWQRNDGAVVWLNGAEVFRSNLPDGEVTYDTLAVVALSADESNRWIVDYIPSSSLLPGVNVFATEVHQSAVAEASLGFDFELLAALPPAGPPPPQLRIQALGGDSLWVAWPYSQERYRLEFTRTLEDASSWIAVPGYPKATAEEYYYEISAPDGAYFFRLLKD